MESLLLWAGRVSGIAGILVCAFAAAVRFKGNWSYGGFQVGTLLQAGMALLLVACLAYCACVAERSSK